jgi:hypothetical protein
MVGASFSDNWSVAGVIMPHWLHEAETEKRRITINKEKRT